jgi:hypothetical protein
LTRFVSLYSAVLAAAESVNFEAGQTHSGGDVGGGDIGVDGVGNSAAA